MKKVSVLAIFSLIFLLSVVGALADSRGNHNRNFSSEDQAAISKAMGHFQDNKGKFGINNPSEELRAKSVQKDFLDWQHVRFDQYYKGVRVCGGEIVAHIKPDGTVNKGTGKFAKDIDIDVTPMLTAEAAAEIALNHHEEKEGGEKVSKSELVLFPVEGIYRLCWQLIVAGDTHSDSWSYIIVDADGEIIRSALRVVLGEDPNCMIGTGTGVSGIYHDHVDTYLKSDGLYYLIDCTRQLNNNIHGHNGEMPDGNYISTHHHYDPNSTIPEYYPGFPLLSDYNLMKDDDNVWDNDGIGWEAQDKAIDAHVYAGYFYDWLLATLGRNSFDGDGGSMRMAVDDNSYIDIIDNAGFWFEGNCVTFGMVSDDIESLSSFPDIVAHEWSHGITGTHIYFDDIPSEYHEMWALHESFSDMMGAAFEWAHAAEPEFAGRVIWLIGEGYAGPGTFIRSMENPLVIKHYTQIQYCIYPHNRAGVGDKWFYLLSEGGQYVGYTVNGIGIENAIQIAYLANVGYWTASTTYNSAVEGTIEAAYALESSKGLPTGTFADEVKTAWDAVGVYGYTDNIPDTDGDNLNDLEDPCPYVYSPGYNNSDFDILFDECDNCKFIANDDQIDSDDDMVGDACDNCLDLANREQQDFDFDGYGDLCDYDDDGDGLDDNIDVCPYTAGNMQEPVGEWETHLPSNYTKLDVSIIGMDDGGYILSNTQLISLYGSDDFTNGAVMKLDPCGSKYWWGPSWIFLSPLFPGNFSIYDNAPAPNGCIVSCGSRRIDDNDDYDLCLEMIGDRGQMVWEQIYDYNDNDLDTAYSIDATADGGYIFCGTMTEAGEYNRKMFFIKTDADGNELWRKTLYADNSPAAAKCVRQTTDGGYIACGYRVNSTVSNTEIVVVRLDAAGNVVWTKVVEETGYMIYYGSEARSVRETPEGDFIVVGGRTNDGDVCLISPMSTYIMKLDPNGDIIWTTTDILGGLGAYDVEITSDGCYLIGGTKMMEPPVPYNQKTVFWTAKIDPDGDVLLEKTYSDDKHGICYDVILDSDGYIVAAGAVENVEYPYTDYPDLLTVRFEDGPPPPTLVAPADNQSYYAPATVHFDWTDVEDVPMYLLEINTDQSFSELNYYNSWVYTSEMTPPITFPADDYYWRVRSVNDIGLSVPSDYRSFSVTSPTPTSCPILFSYDGSEFVRENPILASSSDNGYTGDVTDFYRVKNDVAAEDSKVVFQLRELEDEITYLSDIELISVDHSLESKVGSSTDGHIYVYETSIPPLSAVDNEGVDQLEVVVNEDNVKFVSKEDGYLILTFPFDDTRTGFTFTAAKTCYDPNKPKTAGDSPYDPPIALKIEVMDNGGNWVEWANSLPQKNGTQEFVFGALPVEVEGDILTVRISWEGGFSTDVIGQYLSSDEVPTIQAYTVSEFDFPVDIPTARTWSGFGGEPLEMIKGDIFEFAFEISKTVPEGMTRDYFIRARGYYIPDYSIYTDVLPGKFQLYGNRPNPFNPTTVISYDLPMTADVKLDIYNVLGRHVATLVNNTQEAGHYEVTWDSRDMSGNSVANGVYLYRLEAGKFTASKKMLLLK